MKSYEELLSDIEEDMELMGSSHIVYAMEEDGIVTDYDYLPSDSCTISITLKRTSGKNPSADALCKNLRTYSLKQTKMLRNWPSFFRASDTPPTSPFCTIPAVLPGNTVIKIQHRILWYPPGKCKR